jgi:hypothetical protein
MGFWDAYDDTKSVWWFGTFGIYWETTKLTAQYKENHQTYMGNNTKYSMLGNVTLSWNNTPN